MTYDQAEKIAIATHLIVGTIGAILVALTIDCLSEGIRDYLRRRRK